VTVAAGTGDRTWHQGPLADDAGLLTREHRRSVIASIHRQATTRIATTIGTMSMAPIHPRTTIPFDVELEDPPLAAPTLDAGTTRTGGHVIECHAGVRLARIDDEHQLSALDHAAIVGG